MIEESCDEVDEPASLNLNLRGRVKRHERERRPNGSGVKKIIFETFADRLFHKENVTGFGLQAPVHFRDEFTLEVGFINLCPPSNDATVFRQCPDPLPEIQRKPIYGFELHNYGTFLAKKSSWVNLRLD